MKSLIKKIIKSFNNTKYIAFFTIDNHFVSGAVYKNEYKNLEKNLIVSANNKVYGVDENGTITSISLLANSIAECLDKLEEKLEFRIKNIVLSLVGFESKSVGYSLELSKVKSLHADNLLNHINPTEVSYYLGSDYTLTNLLPLKVTTKSKQDASDKNQDNIISDQNYSSTIDFLIAGFHKNIILQVLDIFYNLSIEVDNIIYAPLVLPFINNSKHNEQAIILISSDYTLINNNEVIESIFFGTNFIIKSLSQRANIPYEVLQKYSHIVNNVLLDTEEFSLFRIENFAIENIRGVINKSLKDYLNKLEHLITSKNLNNYDKIVVINNNLKFLKEQNLLELPRSLNLEFKNTYNVTKFMHKEISNAEIINKAVAIYYIKNINHDFALLDFKKRVTKIKSIYKY